MTRWDVRGARHSSRHRATAVSMVTLSKERPSSWALWARLINDSPSGPECRVAGMPEVGPLGVDPRRGGPLAHAQAGVLIGTEEVPELEVVVAWQALEPTPKVAPQHGYAADQQRVGGEAVEGNRQVIKGRGAHEVLPEPGPKPAAPDALLAGALWAQVNEADGLENGALGDPATHAGPVAVD